MSGEGGVNNFLLLITYVKKKDPQCLVVSIIIPIFVWTVERSESGSGGMSFAEGRLPRAWSGETIHPVWFINGGSCKVSRTVESTPTCVVG